MSRSYKKSPTVTIVRNGMKAEANNRVRKTIDIPPKGNFYRRIFESYDITDYAHTQTAMAFKLKMDNIKNETCCMTDKYAFDKYKAEKINEHSHRDFDKYLNYREWYRSYKRK